MNTIEKNSEVLRNLNATELSPRLAEMKRRIRSGGHHRYRETDTIDVRSECDAENLSWMQRTARLTRRMCEAQTVVIEPDEKIVFTRTGCKVAPIYSDSEMRTLTAGRPIHELGPISNICADWGMVLSQGLLARREVALRTKARLQADAEVVEFLDCAIETIDAVLALAARYAQKAWQMGRYDLSDILDRLPAQPATTFRGALQAVRLCHAVLWLSGHYHCGLGRFDQYMWPYLQADLEAGRLNQVEAEELLAEFFVSLNKDSDLYPGIQQGDNGQSLMLGGMRRDGSSGVNPLTAIVLRVARAVALIDPKINLRVDRNTDLNLLAQALELTRIGLGFPQYANDEVVIPGLVAAGYELEDARDYTVAACWEFCIPGRGMEVVNIGAASMPAAVDKAIRDGLARGSSFEQIVEQVGNYLHTQVAALAEGSRKLFLPSAPYYSVLMDGCLENGRDLSHGLKYNNFGIHGAASANAADALAAVKAFVFDDKRVAPDRLLRALENNFASDEVLRRELSELAPKVGNHDDRADLLLVKLFDLFADACDAAGENGRGGRYRPGSGSAMYYVWLARGHEGMREPAVSATADGRRAGEYFSSSLAPSPGVVVQGPFSVLQSFGKIDYRRICNGGPLTMELANSLFNGRDTTRKMALFIRAFVKTGCQQLQLNTLNVDTLRDAQRHPELHKNLVVRVWGWSGYFCELDEAYQNQIIGRHIYGASSCNPS
jgi:formate C-acetyltransferase